MLVHTTRDSLLLFCNEGAWSRQISTVSNGPPTEPMVSARPYYPGSVTPMPLKTVTQSMAYPMPRQVVSSYVAGPQAFTNFAPVDPMRMKRPSISIPATKTVQPFAQQPFPHPIPVTRMPMESMEASKLMASIKMTPQVSEKPQEAVEVPETSPEKEPVKVPSEMPVNAPSNKEECENVVDNAKMEEQAKQLMPVPVDGRLKMVAKRMLQGLKGCVFCK